MPIPIIPALAAAATTATKATAATKVIAAATKVIGIVGPAAITVAKTVATTAGNKYFGERATIAAKKTAVVPKNTVKIFDSSLLKNSVIVPALATAVPLVTALVIKEVVTPRIKDGGKKRKTKNPKNAQKKKNASFK